MTLSAHSTSDTNIAGLPNFAPQSFKSVSVSRADGRSDGACRSRRASGHLAGRMAKKLYATASSPLEGVVRGFRVARAPPPASFPYARFPVETLLARLSLDRPTMQARDVTSYVSTKTKDGSKAALVDLARSAILRAF